MKGRRTRGGFYYIVIASVLTTATFGTGPLYGDGYPHQPENGIYCYDCHYIHDGPLVVTGIDLLIMCQACHNPLGRASDKSDVGLHTTSVDTVDCGKCHDPHFPTEPNADHIRSEVRYPTVYNLCDYPDITPRKYVRGADPYDGICEVCHTATAYHRNTAEGNHVHNVGQVCTTCHPHEDGFMPTGGDCDACHGQPPDGTEFPNTEGSHPAHMGGIYGPGITDCFVCHATLGGTHQNGLPSFASGVDANANGNIELDETDVCDVCHSPDGPFDGVVEARANWLTASRVSCEGCHDTGTSVIQGVGAPPVAGDNVTWGFYATGHGEEGVTCAGCHDPDVAHIDGNARTYEVSSSGVVNPYRESYRLTIGLDIPRPSTSVQEPEVWRYELCFSCHDWNKVLGDPLLDPSSDFYRSNYGTGFRHGPLGYGSWGHGGWGEVMSNAATDTSITFSWWQEWTGRGSPGSMREYVVPDISNPDFIYEVLDPNDWWSWFNQSPVYLESGSTALTDNPDLWNGGQTAYAFGIPNNHYFHLSNIGSWWDWDSDWDGVFIENGYESTRSCPTCHNVHGSTYHDMIRDGQLVGITGLQYAVDPAYPDEGAYLIPYESGTCEGLCHTGWNNGYVPREVYWYR